MLDRALAEDKDVMLAVKVLTADALQELKLTSASSGTDEPQPPSREAWLSGQGYRTGGTRSSVGEMGR